MSAQVGEVGTLLRCGDQVLHEPNGEYWLVAHVDDFVLAPAGWPDSRVQTTSCTIVKLCTDQEHAAAVDGTATLRQGTTVMTEIERLRQRVAGGRHAGAVFVWTDNKDGQVAWRTHALVSDGADIELSGFHDTEAEARAAVMSAVAKAACSQVKVNHD